MAALRAKKQGDIEEARDYLRMAKVCRQFLHYHGIIWFSGQVLPEYEKHLFSSQPDKVFI